MKKIKIALLATLGLAMAFAFSCSTDDGGDGSTTNNTTISSSSVETTIVTYYDVVIGNLSTNCPNINLYPELLNSVMPVTDTWVDIARNCIINRQDYYNQTPSQVTSFLTANNLGVYINDFNQKIPMSPYYEGILIYTNTSGYYTILVIGYSGYNRIPSISSSSAKIVSSSSKTTVSSSSVGTISTCDLNCASQVESEMATQGSLFSGAFCSKVASCGTGCKARYSQCGSGSSIVECGTSSYNTNNTNLRCENDVVETRCGTNSWYDTTNVNLRCQNNVVETRCGSGWYNSLTHLCIDGEAIREGTFTDVRDNKTYKWVKIGTQIWMAENLNYNAIGSKCYNDNESNCAIYGRLYKWATAMANSASSATNPSGVKGVCPVGWHLPSNAEWNGLMKFVDPSCTGNNRCAGAGKKLKVTSGWSYNGNGTDDYGFSALPGGYGGSDGSFGNVGEEGNWWSATENDASYADLRSMMYYHEGIAWPSGGKSNLYSVRCLQD